MRRRVRAAPVGPSGPSDSRCAAWTHSGNAGGGGYSEQLDVLEAVQRTGGTTWSTRQDVRQRQAS